MIGDGASNHINAPPGDLPSCKAARVVAPAVPLPAKTSCRAEHKTGKSWDAGYSQFTHEHNYLQYHSRVTRTFPSQEKAVSRDPGLKGNVDHHLRLVASGAVGLSLFPSPAVLTKCRSGRGSRPISAD